MQSMYNIRYTEWILFPLLLLFMLMLRSIIYLIFNINVNISYLLHFFIIILFSFFIHVFFFYYLLWLIILDSLQKN